VVAETGEPLLTLIGTPVVYSLFDDWAESPLWGRLARLVPGRSNGNGREGAATS
jgi:hypothetical protein